jgi:hypothetical protein
MDDCLCPTIIALTPITFPLYVSGKETLTEPIQSCKDGMFIAAGSQKRPKPCKGGMFIVTKCWQKSLN